MIATGTVLVASFKMNVAPTNVRPIVDLMAPVSMWMPPLLLGNSVFAGWDISAKVVLKVGSMPFST